MEININETREKLLKNRGNAVAFLAQKMAKHPDMVKASHDIQLIDEQLEKLEAMEKAQKDADLNKANEEAETLEKAVNSAIDLFSDGNVPEDSALEEIAKAHNLTLEQLEDALAAVLEKD